MNRREALKNIGLSVGYTVAVPSLISLLHSCKTEAEVWMPQFLSIDEGVILKNLVDLILPKTEDTPGALDVNVPQFIDLCLAKASSDKQQAKFKTEFTAVINALKIPEEDPSKLKVEDYDSLLAKYLKVTKSQIKEFSKNEKDKLIFSVLSYIRSQSIWAYKNTEFIGENVLKYDPIPGSNVKACPTVEEATGGKAWSLEP